MVVAASAVDVAVAVAVAVVMIMTTTTMTTMSGHTSGQCSRDHLEQETCNVL